MRYAAEVKHLTTRPDGDDRFTVVPVEGVNAFEAARRVAEIAAARRYEEVGSVGYTQFDGTDGWYRASIGVQRKSDDGIATRGVTISIHVWPVD